MKFAALALLVFGTLGGLLLGVAGTWDYWQAWTYLAALAVPLAFAARDLHKRDPGLLQRRMQYREKTPTRRRILSLALIPYLGIYVVPALDRRFGWAPVPWFVCLAALGVLLAGYGLIILVLRVNTWASRIVEVRQEQTVVTTGPYALIRHPFYLGTLIMYGATPVALGSWWGLLPFLVLPVVLVLRIQDEEALLRDELAGYREYMERVRYRLLPGVW